MSALLSLFDAGTWAWIGGIAVAGLAIIWRMLAGAKKAGRDEQIAKEAKARDENLKRIKTAADAGARVQPDDPGMHNDPHDLDR